MKKYLYSFKNDGSFFDHGLVEISDDGFLEDGTPIEDLGDYLLADEPCEDPFEEFLKLLERDGLKQMREDRMAGRTNGALIRIRLKAYDGDRRGAEEIKKLCKISDKAFEAAWKFGQSMRKENK